MYVHIIHRQAIDVANLAPDEERAVEPVADWKQPQSVQSNAENRLQYADVKALRSSNRIRLRKLQRESVRMESEAIDDLSGSALDVCVCGESTRRSTMKAYMCSKCGRCYHEYCILPAGNLCGFCVEQDLPSEDKVLSRVCRCRCIHDEKKQLRRCSECKIAYHPVCENHDPLADRFLCGTCKWYEDNKSRRRTRPWSRKQLREQMECLGVTNRKASKLIQAKLRSKLGNQKADACLRIFEKPPTKMFCKNLAEDREPKIRRVHRRFAVTEVLYFEESCKVCGRCMPQHQDPALFPNKTIKFKHFHRDFVKAYECVNKRCDCRVKTYSKLEGLRCAHDYEWDEDETLPDHLKRHIKEVTSYNSSTTLNFYSMFYSIMHITYPSRTSTIVNFYSILLDTYYMHSHTQTHIGANLRGLFQRQRC